MQVLSFKTVNNINSYNDKKYRFFKKYCFIMTQNYVNEILSKTLLFE